MKIALSKKQESRCNFIAAIITAAVVFVVVVMMLVVFGKEIAVNQKFFEYIFSALSLVGLLLYLYFWYRMYRVK